jgi:dethiobiotin synthetase
MGNGLFITGTDTGIGKTWISAAIMQLLKAQHQSVIGMKPIASGCEPTADGLRNEDALLLQQQSSIEIDYQQINPYAFEPAIAPHIAAAQSSVTIDIQHIKQTYQALSQQADWVIVEGVGGWLVPLNEDETVADLACALDLPIILVVGMRLGCINHALLSAASIEQSGLQLAGWIANFIDPQMTEQQHNLHSIQQRIAAPLLGSVPYQQELNAEHIAGWLDL